MANLAQNLLNSARTDPDAVALRQDEETWTFGALDAATARMAGWLAAHGVSADDRVALSLPNIPAFAIVFYGALRLGAVVVPMNPLFRPREVAYYLQDSGAALLVGCTDDAVEGAADAGVAYVPVADLAGLLGEVAPLADVVERGSDDTAVLLYTSGTTGRPKGAELRHGNLDVNQEVSGRTLLQVRPDDIIMGCLPLFHVFGLTCALNVAVAAGATLTLIPRFDPAKALEVVTRDRVTIFEGVPTMYGAMLGAAGDREVDTSSLRTCISGGASMPVELMRGFEKRFGCVILEGYGLSETSPVASFNHPNAQRKPGSIGTAIEGVEMRCVDAVGEDVPVGEIGEIIIRGHNIMRGYWNRREETAEAIRDGWFHTGDLARLDADGYFFIVDRTKDLIIRGGYNVYPREIEEVLYEHPAIAEAAVVGRPDAHLGEEVVAYVVAKPGANIDPDEVQAFTKERVAAYKYPRTVHLIAELPKGATGKILKRELRQETPEG